MCGRYTIGTDAAALEARFQAQAAAGIVSPSYNAAPSQRLPTIFNASPHAITISAWGFLPAWADGRPDVKPLINARAETVGINTRKNRLLSRVSGVPYTMPRAAWSPRLPSSRRMPTPWWPRSITVCR